MRLYTSAEVARLTGRKRTTILALAQRYPLGTKVGRDWVFTEEDLEKIRAINPRGGRPSKRVKQPPSRP